MGKTELARSYFQNPFEHRDAVCWAGYDEDKHDVIIFGDVKMRSTSTSARIEHCFKPVAGQL
eukprot:420663-Prymnesium_polylepis.2